MRKLRPNSGYLRIFVHIHDEIMYGSRNILLLDTQLNWYPDTDNIEVKSIEREIEKVKNWIRISSVFPILKRMFEQSAVHRHTFTHIHIEIHSRKHNENIHGSTSLKIAH